MKFKSGAKFWDVRFTKPCVRTYKGHDGSDKVLSTTTNVHAMAVAVSAVEAVAAIITEFPEAVIHQVNHRGADCAIVVQPDLVETGE